MPVVLWRPNTSNVTFPLYLPGLPAQGYQMVRREKERGEKGEERKEEREREEEERGGISPSIWRKTSRISVVFYLSDGM